MCGINVNIYIVLIKAHVLSTEQFANIEDNTAREISIMIMI